MFSAPRRTQVVIGAILLLGLIRLGPSHAIDQGYFDAVEADVAEFATQEFQPPRDSNWLGGSPGDTAQLMDLNGFSDFLRQASPGSFIFYDKLPVEYKHQLHSDYLATGDLERIKQDIFQYTRAVKQ